MVIGIIISAANVPHDNIGLVHIFFLNQIDGWFKFIIYLRDRRYVQFHFFPILEGLFNFLFHGFSIKISPNAHNDIIGMIVFLMEFNQIIPCDIIDGLIFRMAGIRTLRTINQFGEFAVGDLLHIVIPPGNAAAMLNL